MKVTVTNGLGVFVAAFKGNLREQLENGVFKCAQVAAGEIRREVLSTFQGRTGTLARSFKETFLGDSKDGIRSAGAVSDLEYAPIQDEGGTIRSKNGRKLAVPIRGANVPVGKWPRDFAPGQLKLIPRRGRPPLLAKVHTRGAKKGVAELTRIEPVFVLLSSVTISGKGYLKRAADAAAPRMAEIMGDSIKVAVGRSR